MHALIGLDSLERRSELVMFLEGERALKGAVRSVPSPPVDGRLGGAVDVLMIALGSGGVGVALAHSLTTWLRNQRSDVKVTVTVADRVVELEARRVSDVPDLLK